MATKETAKPCPSADGKKSKVLILKEVLGWAGWIYRGFNLVDDSWDWFKDHFQVIMGWFGDLL